MRRLTSTTFLAGAIFEIGSGVTVSGFTAIRGVLFEVGSGATAIGDGGRQRRPAAVSGGTARSTIVLGGGTMLVLSGGTTIGDVLVGSGSTLVASETVSAGGVASGTVLSNTGLLTVSAAARPSARSCTQQPAGQQRRPVVSCRAAWPAARSSAAAASRRCGRHGERHAGQERRQW